MRHRQRGATWRRSLVAATLGCLVLSPFAASPAAAKSVASDRPESSAPVDWFRDTQPTLPSGVSFIEGGSIACASETDCVFDTGLDGDSDAIGFGYTTDGGTQWHLESKEVVTAPGSSQLPGPAACVSG